MKTLFVCASVITLFTAGLPAQANPDFMSMDPYFAGAPEEEQGKQEEQGKEEEKKQDENKQEDQNQEEQGQDEQGRSQRGFLAEEDSALEAQRWGRGRFLCYARNLRGGTFQAQGFQRFMTQRRAVQNCRARSGFILGRSCTAAGCRRF